MDFSEDQDKLFSYFTKQQVNIQDRWLGFTNICLQFLILVYIVLGIFYFGEGYLEFEGARGAIATHVKGDTVAVSSGKPGTRYFSAEEITYPGLENGNVFVATRMKVHRQRRGVCEDNTMPCSSTAECTTVVGGQCSENGFCLEPSWCNEEAQPEIYELEVGELLIWAKSSIQFLGLASQKIYSTETNHPYPERYFNLFSVRDLLMMCEPVPVRYEEISQLGAAIEVQFVWDCNVAEERCKPQVKARRLDVLFDPEDIGYKFSYPEYVSEDERVLNEVRGIRIFLRTYGTGRKLSVNDLIVKASTTLTLMSLAPIIADLLMLSVLRTPKLRAKYRARKYEYSPDFSDYMAKLKLKKEQDEALPTKVEEEDRTAQEKEDSWQRRLDEEDYAG